MNKPTIWFASANQGKINEINYLCQAYQLRLMSDVPTYQEPAETGTTFEANALIKAKSLSEVVDGWVIGDDSGLCVEALNGFPGIHSKRWAYPETDERKLCELLLAKLRAETDLTNMGAYFETCLVLYHARLNKQYVFKGVCHGQLSFTLMQSPWTFAYDMIFIPDQFKKHCAQLDAVVKRTTSARGQAVRQLINFLESEEFKHVV